MIMTVQGMGEGTAGAEHSSSFHASASDQHDSFMSSGSSRTEASSPSSTSGSVSVDSDEGVDMTSSPNLFSRNFKSNKNLYDPKKRASEVIMAYRRLSLNGENSSDNDKPMDLSMRNKMPRKTVEDKEIKPSNVLPYLYQFPLLPMSHMGFALAQGLWHPELLAKNDQSQLTSTSSPLLPIPNVFSTASGINQIAGRPPLYDTNMLAHFSRLVTAHQANAKVFQDSTSSFREAPSPASSVGSSKRKLNEEGSVSNRASPTGSCHSGSDPNESDAQPNKRARWQEQSKIFSGVPTYIENDYQDLPTMVPNSYKDVRSNETAPAKEPTLVDFKPCRYPCTQCGRTYATIGGLVKHSKSHNDPDSSKVFKCKTCEKEYSSLGALKMHIRTHTLPCKCHICGKAFSRTWLLQGHIRTHTGEKPYQCSVCMRSFADRSNLRAHMQTHEAVKRYACTNCDKTYSRISLLNRHQANGCGQNKTTE